MTLVMMTVFASCKAEERREPDVQEQAEFKIDIEDLKTIEGPMLEITRTIQEPVPEDIERDYLMTLTYSGEAINPNPVNDACARVTDEEYLTVYRFCIESITNNTYADYYEDVCDGDTYRFVFYDEDGNAHEIYDGYIYDNEELSSVVSIISSYQLD